MREPKTFLRLCLVALVALGVALPADPAGKRAPVRTNHFNSAVAEAVRAHPEFSHRISAASSVPRLTPKNWSGSIAAPPAAPIDAELLDVLGKTKFHLAESGGSDIEPLTSYLERQGFALELRGEGEQPDLHLRVGRVQQPHFKQWLADAALARTILTAMKRDDILERMGVQNAIALEPRAAPGLRSQLVEDLEKAGVPDYIQVARSFDQNAVVKAFETPAPISLLRLYGQDALPTGRYYFCCRETGLYLAPNQPIYRTDASGLATPPQNMLYYLAVVTVPAGTPVYAGGVANAFGKPGGNVQFFIPEARAPLSTIYELAGKKPFHEADFAVEFDDDSVLRFRLKTQ